MPTDQKASQILAAKRQRDLRARRLAAGLTEVRNIYLPPALHAVLKKLAKTLN